MLSPIRLVILVVSMVLPAWAEAGEPEPPSSPAQVRHLLQLGQEQYDAGRYLEAAATYSQAYSLRPLPNLLFNIGQAYRRGGRDQDAIRLYQQFLATDPPPELRAETLGYLHQVQARDQVQRAIVRRPAARPARVPLYRRPWFWTLAGVGLATVVAGAVLWGLDGSQNCPLVPPQRQCPQVLDTAPAGIGVFAGGTAMLASLGITLAVEERARRNEARTAVLALGGSF